VSLFAPTRHYVATLVNPSTQYDAITATSHRALIALRLLGGVAGLPLHLTTRGAPSAIEGTALLVAAILLTRFLSRAGDARGRAALSVWIEMRRHLLNRKGPPLCHLPPRAYSAGAWQAPLLGAYTPVKNSA
jgi:hypothetical protein